MKKEFEIGKLPDDFKKEIHSQIRLFSVVLLISNDDSSYISVSGTLCKIGEHHGILTARHNWDESQVGIKDNKQLMIIVGKGAVSFETDTLSPIIPLVEGKLYDTGVPDIAFIKIPQKFISKIESYEKIFYSIDKRLDMDEHDIYGDDGYWSLFGSPVEKLKTEERSASSTIYGTSIPSKSEHDSWDYLELEILVEEGEMPEVAKGFSGGGIWKTKFAVDAKLNEFCILDIILSGVNFYQSNEGSRYNIVGHGPKSIYSRLFDLVSQT